MKKFCVLFLSREDWNSPEIVFVDSKDEDAARILALKKIGYSEEEETEMIESGEYTIKVIELK